MYSLLVFTKKEALLSFWCYQNTYTKNIHISVSSLYRVGRLSSARLAIHSPRIASK